MIQAQLVFIEDISPLITDISQSFTAYFTYNKSESEFLGDIESFKKRYSDFLARRNEFNRTYVVEIKSEQLISALSGIEDASGAILVILEEADILKREELLYIYLRQMQVMQRGIDVFMENAAYVIL